MKIMMVAGARPNFMKIAPLVKTIKEYNSQIKGPGPHIKSVLLHTGQHYDTEMSQSFFVDLELPRPDRYLGVGPGPHGEQTGKIMIEFEKACVEENPDLVIVVGDVNSTLACAIAAAKLLIPVAHVEAGLRSFDRSMPEETNRVLTDRISDYLFTSCEEANENLKKEGIAEDKVFFVGNVMIDTLLDHIERAKSSSILSTLGLKEQESVKKYALLTLHRPSNVDDPMILEGILSAVNTISEEIPVIAPLHPRTMKKIREFDLTRMIEYTEELTPLKKNHEHEYKKIFSTPPVGYLDFLQLMSNAKMILTDSGGIQEETTILGIPCLTLRNNTERPITVQEGTNIIVGNDPDKIVHSAKKALTEGIPSKKVPKFWDGKAAERIISVIVDKIRNRSHF